MWTENRFPDGYRYPLPPGPAAYVRSLAQLAQHPPEPNADVTPNGVAVSPRPVQQRTRIGVFKAR
jgi:hypothetical protein